MTYKSMKWYGVGIGLGMLLGLIGPTYAGLTDNFDPPNTNVTATQVGTDPGPRVLSGGPSGQYLRLVNDGVNNQRNRYSYDRTDTGWYSTMTAQFDFSGYSVDQAADGFSFAILPTTLYGASGSGPNLSESASAAGVFGIGFWVYPSGTNHLSVHWDNREIVRYYVDPTKVNFANGTWNQAKLTINSIGPGGNVKLELIGNVNDTEPQTVTVFDKYFFGPSGFENRVQFSGRTGGADMDVNLDNIQVSYSNPIASPPGSITPPANTLVQDFDHLGTTHFVANQYSSSPGPQVLAGGPSGNYLRVIQQTNNQTNQIAFDRVAMGLYQRIEAEWDFSILSGADGGAFALVNTGWEGITGPVSNPPVWEEPNIANAFCIGFDVYPDICDISLHWNGQEVATYSTYDYRNAWRTAKAVIEFVSGGANVSLTVGGTSIFTNYFIPGMIPYESRVAFGGRTGGATTNFDLDNITVRWLNAVSAPTDPIHWRGITGDYNGAANWTNNILPTGNDPAVIDVGVATGTVNLQGTGSLTVTGYGGLNASSIQVAGAAGTQGQLILSGNARVRSNGDFYVANGTGAVGNVSIAENASLTVNGEYTIIGRGGEGHVVQNGGTVNVRRLRVAESAGSAGSTYTLNSGALTTSYIVEVGRTELATFTQNGGTVTINSDMYIANKQEGGGTPGGSTYKITNGTLTVTGTHTVVGRGDDGHFVQDGGTVNLKRLFVSEFGGSADSTYTMNAGTLTLSQRMEVGRSELGTFTQTGGVVNALAVEASPDDFSIMIGRYGPGVYNLQGGTLNVGVLCKGSTGQFNFTGGTLHASTVAFDLIHNGGVLAPGNSVGMTTIQGNYQQMLNGILEIEINGFDQGDQGLVGAAGDKIGYDWVNVSGSATLQGDLQIVLLDGFRPQTGDTFDVLTAAGGITDNGLKLIWDDDLLLPAQYWTHQIVSGEGTEQILQLQVGVPEPGTAGLALAGVLCLLAWSASRRPAAKRVKRVLDAK